MTPENPFLKKFETPFDSVPFLSIQKENYKPAILTAIDSAKEEVQAIVSNKKAPTFENTIVALENAGRLLNTVSRTFFNIDSAETNDYIQNVAQEVSPVLSAYENDVTLNQYLFERIKYVYENEDRKKLDAEDIRLLDKMYRSFTKNGALLNDEDKEKLREIDRELSTLKVAFNKNVLADTNAYFLHITKEEDLAGLPPSIQTMAKKEAEKRKLEGWVFTLQFPSLTPFLKYANNRVLRQEIHLAAGKRAYSDNENNNVHNIQQIVELRNERALLLGFESHAAYVLQERMASSPSEIETFLNDLLQKAKPRAIREIQELEEKAKIDAITDIKAFDHAYYAEKLREEKYDINEEALRPYFPLEQVLKAAFDAAQKLYQLEFTAVDYIDTYHTDVTVYNVTENGEHKALLYTDFFPREGKRAGAWMTSFKDQYMDGKKNIRPHISIVCNFSQPSDETPSLLTFMEVTTLFHEFGHALHGIMANTKYESLSGTNVYWDFVELPSQFMENYCYDKTFLQSFAKHYQTGETLSDTEIDKIVASANYMEGYQTLRQISFGLLDMAYHTNQYHNENIESFEQKIMGESQLYAITPGVAMSPSFSHIFSGGYSAGYYSYKWAEVLDADAFAYFKENGIFNEAIAAKFKTLLSKGGTVDPMQLYIDFRGRKPTVDALLKRAGLI